MGQSNEESTGITSSTKNNDGEESEKDDNEKNEPVELLVNTRAKRSTAGNLLHTLLQQQEHDDELGLIFAEDEDDSGFLDMEADQSDIPMDSSSDEEDKGSELGNDLEGEKELQKSLKEARMRSKKNGIGKYKIIKKTPFESVSSHSAQQPKKKSERTSWILNSIEAPVRASSRQTTRQSKQQLQVQMMDREIKRLKQLANVEKTAAAKVAKEAPLLTQEDRLREAARVEKANAKSLSRWERAEREREEEQRLRLNNLHNRHLEGPVITIWSGMATYVGGKLQKIGKLEIISEKPLLKKRKVAGNEEDNDKEDQEEGEKSPESIPNSIKIRNETSTSFAKPSDENPEASASDPIMPSIKSQALGQAPNQSSEKLIPHYSSSCLAPPAGLPLTTSSHPLFIPPSLAGSPKGLVYCSTPKNNMQFLPINHQSHLSPPNQISPAPLVPTLPLSPIITEHCVRSSLIFSNFSDTAIKSRETQLRILFPHFHHFNTTNPRTTISRTPAKGSRNSRAYYKSFPCAITNYPAKYKDPKTGLYYSNLYAYKQLQKLQKGEIWWSDLVGSFVGSGSLNPAKGVPDNFHTGIKEI
ncbi:putative yl1 nuclear protein [Erysiphe necator]|uniref:Putative yl1 nuclear protein n=1 Tax=Uncinula necator TaxID=52586 RepID=A0A0B1PDR3_UNCNE|nr:putative yl1 nuclear protein [Erysiphe necator]